MKLFLSFSHRDQSEAEELISQLQLIDDNLEVLSWSLLEAGTELRSSTVSAIRSANAVVALFSGRSESVLFEAGIATGLGKPIIALTKDASWVPSDLQNTPFVKLLGEPHHDAQNLYRAVKKFDFTEVIEAGAFLSAEANLRACIDNRRLLEEMNPLTFEQTIERYFGELGFDVDANIGSNSREVDFVACRKGGQMKLLVETKKLAVHAKVSSETVERVAASMSFFGVAAGLIVSSSSFTSTALALASKYGIALRTIEQLLSSDGLRDLISKD